MDRYPDITCLCMYHGRNWCLREALEAFYRQELPAGMTAELLVLNDMDEQRPWTDLLKVPAGKSVRIVHMRPGLDQARKQHEGFRLALGETVLMWDDDDISLPWRAAESVKWLRRRAGIAAVRPYGALVMSDGRILEFQHKSLWWGGAAVDRTCYLNCGGARTGFWNDADAWDRMAKAWDCGIVPLTPDTTWYVYRWGGMGWHDSGAGEDNAQLRATQFHNGVIRDPRFVRGEVEIVPVWHQDYVSVAARYAQQYQK